MRVWEGHVRELPTPRAQPLLIEERRPVELIRDACPREEVGDVLLALEHALRSRRHAHSTADAATQARS